LIENTEPSLFDFNLEFVEDRRTMKIHSSGGQSFIE